MDDGVLAWTFRQGYVLSIASFPFFQPLHQIHTINFWSSSLFHKNFSLNLVQDIFICRQLVMAGNQSRGRTKKLHKHEPGQQKISGWTRQNSGSHSSSTNPTTSTKDCIESDPNVIPKDIPKVSVVPYSHVPQFTKPSHGPVFDARLSLQTGCLSPGSATPCSLPLSSSTSSIGLVNKSHLPLPFGSSSPGSAIPYSLSSSSSTSSLGQVNKSHMSLPTKSSSPELAMLYSLPLNDNPSPSSDNKPVLLVPTEGHSPGSAALSSLPTLDGIPSHDSVGDDSLPQAHAMSTLSPSERRELPVLLPELLPEVLDQCLPGRPGHKWSANTWMLRKWEKNCVSLVATMEYFSVPRTENQLLAFLHREVPVASGWIWPLLKQFRLHTGQSCNLTLLFCPKKDTDRVDFTNPLEEEGCFSLVMVTAINEIIKEVHGHGYIGIDCRKQCRRLSKDDGCATFTNRERHLYTLATRVELLIARNVFGITFVRTIGWGKDVAAPSGNLDELLDFSRHPLGHLMGEVHAFPDHPRCHTFLGINGSFSQVAFRSSIKEKILPTLSYITKIPVDDLFDRLLRRFLQSECEIMLRRVVPFETVFRSVNSPLDMSAHADNPTHISLNRLLMAAWALMTESDASNRFAFERRIPSSYVFLKMSVTSRQPETDYLSYHNGASIDDEEFGLSTSTLDDNLRLLARWRSLRRLPGAAPFLKDGELPDEYLRIPAQFKDAISHVLHGSNAVASPNNTTTQSTFHASHGSNAVAPLNNTTTKAMSAFIDVFKIMSDAQIYPDETPLPSKPQRGRKRKEDCTPTVSRSRLPPVLDPVWVFRAKEWELDDGIKNKGQTLLGSKPAYMKEQKRELEKQMRAEYTPEEKKQKSAEAAERKANKTPVQQQEAAIAQRRAGKKHYDKEKEKADAKKAAGIPLTEEEVEKKAKRKRQLKEATAKRKEKKLKLELEQSSGPSVQM